MKEYLTILKNDKINSIFCILLGNTIFALAIVMFVMPNDLVTGGATGLALFLNRSYGVNMSLFLAIFNGLLFLVGWYFLGIKFVLTSLLSTVYYPVILEVLQKFPQLLMPIDDKFLATVFAGVLIGVGVGIVIRVDASTGGIDIPALILNKKAGVPVAVTLWVLDVIILLLQIVENSKESLLYGVVLIVVYTSILNRVLLLGRSQVQVKIISKKYQEINDCILHQLNRGSTLVRSQSGYAKEEGYMVMSIIANRELQKMNKMVMEIDPYAFMVINQVNEVKGKGFTLPKNL